MSLPDWITIGAPAVILRRPTHYTPSITRVTVKTIATKSFSTTDGKTTVRWRIPEYTDTRIFRSLGTWNGSECLLPPEHPEVLDALAQIEAARTAAQATVRFERWNKARTDEALTQQLVDAVQAAHAAAVAVNR